MWISTVSLKYKVFSQCSEPWERVVDEHISMSFSSNTDVLEKWAYKRLIWYFSPLYNAWTIQNFRVVFHGTFIAPSSYILFIYDTNDFKHAFTKENGS